MENNWKYIDEYKSCPGTKVIYCDTRDFHIICHNEIEDDVRGFVLNTKPTEDQLWRQDEILGFLKTLESESGGQGKWRCIVFDKDKKLGLWRHILFPNDNGGWRKYLRFYKVGEIDTLDGTKGTYVCWAGGYPHNMDDWQKGLLNRKDHKPEYLDSDLLNFIKDE